ncbi:MAG: SDR family NAD(P)-dependent oxidoreductase [Thermodesulfobacteriota bacterium]
MILKRLENRTAIVTGAARGMGFTIARALLQEGAKVAIADVDQAAVNSACKELDRNGTRIIGEKIDVRNKTDVVQFVEKVHDLWGRIDILVNNAGGALRTPHVLAEIDEKDWDLVLDVNLKGAFFFCQAVIPLMAQQKGGAIINMSALAGHWRASLAGVQYTASKAGLEGLTRQLAYDWGKAGIRVNAVAPTVTLTGDRIQALWDAKGDSGQEKVLAAIPLGRLGTMEEVAAVVVFLASDESGYITGQTVDISGGRYLR